MKISATDPDLGEARAGRDAVIAADIAARLVRAAAPTGDLPQGLASGADTTWLIAQAAATNAAEKLYLVQIAI